MIHPSLLTKTDDGNSLTLFFSKVKRVI